MEKKSTDLQHVVFETEEAGRVEAMWSSLRLNGQDVPDGWHRYAVRGGDDETAPQEAAAEPDTSDDGQPAWASGNY